MRLLEKAFLRHRGLAQADDHTVIHFSDLLCCIQSTICYIQTTVEHANESLGMVPPTWAPWVTTHVGESDEGEREGAVAIDRRLRERAVKMARNDYELGLLLRRGFVITRHEHRCAVPGCRHARHLDVHHTVLRSEGGTHDAE